MCEDIRRCFYLNNSYGCEPIPLSLCAGWSVLENSVVTSESAMREQRILKLEYIYKERKQAFSYQSYTVLVTVDFTGKGNDSTKYYIKLFVIPCDQECYCLEKQFCNSLTGVMEKIEFITYQYSNPNSWPPEHIRWINKIWLEAKERKNFKRIKIYNHSETSVTPVKLMPIKIPKGWTIVINSFYKSYSFKAVASLNQCESELSWDRDIAIFVNRNLENNIYVDLEDFTNINRTTSAIHIHAYKIKQDDSAQSTELESAFCLGVNEAVLKLEYLLCKYSKN